MDDQVKPACIGRLEDGKKSLAESIKQHGVTDHRFLMSGRERFSQLPMHHEMMAGFYHQMDVDEKILIFDGDLDDHLAFLTLICIYVAPLCEMNTAPFSMPRGQMRVKSMSMPCTLFALSGSRLKCFDATR